MKIKSILSLSLCGFITLVVIAYSFVIYVNEEEALLNGLDEKLYTTAVLAKNLLPSDYHDGIQSSNSVTLDEYEQIVDKYKVPRRSVWNSVIP